MRNYSELSYWEQKAEDQLRNPQMPMLMNRGMGTITNNRKATNGRKIQVIPLKGGGTKQIRKPHL
jgi:hypothetical protein